MPWTLLDPVLMVIPSGLLEGFRVNAAYHLRLVAFAFAGSPLDRVPTSPARLCAEEDGAVTQPSGIEGNLRRKAWPGAGRSYFFAESGVAYLTVCARKTEPGSLRLRSH